MIDNKDKQTSKKQFPQTFPPYEPSEDILRASNNISIEKSKKFAAESMKLFKLA